MKERTGEKKEENEWRRNRGNAMKFWQIPNTSHHTAIKYQPVLCFFVVLFIIFSPGCLVKTGLTVLNRRHFFVVVVF